MDEHLTGYELSRNWFDWCFENPDLINPTHTALFFFAIEHWNRLGQKDKFGLPTQMCMDAIGISNWRTFSKAFNNLVEWGFFKLVTKSKNQYSATVIAIVKNTKAHTKAYTKATQKHVQKQSKSIAVIDKPINLITLEPINRENKFSIPTLDEVKNYCLERKNDVDPEKWIDFYSSKGWMIGKNKMKDWKAAVRTWEKSNNHSNGENFKFNAKGKLAGNYKAAEEFAREIEEKSRNFVSPLQNSSNISQ